MREFTDRQQQVLHMIGAGCCNKRIARVLDLSVSTVMTHVTAVKAKVRITDDPSGRRLACFAARWVDAQKVAA
jgi:DNA-binding NarL/FixJ family response regulator